MVINEDFKKKADITMVNDLVEKVSLLEKKLETLQTEVLQVHYNKVKIDEGVLKNTVNEQITQYNNVRSRRNFSLSSVTCQSKAIA